MEDKGDEVSGKIEFRKKLRCLDGGWGYVI